MGNFNKPVTENSTVLSNYNSSLTAVFDKDSEQYYNVNKNINLNAPDVSVKNQVVSKQIVLKEAVTLIVDEIAKSNIYTMRVFYG